MAFPLARARTALLVAALVGTLTLAGCSGSSGGSSEGTDVGEAAAVESTTTTEAAPTTTAAPVATTAPAPIGLFSPQESAQKLYDAWKADDRATAATLAEPTAVEEIWATAPGDYTLYNKCDSGEFGTSGCLFRGNNGTIQFTTERRGDRWVVIQAFFSGP
ncbi:MAG: hypothetical protein KDB04_14410 [Acidimicrobiales bacterium]|nr:hypothetical protein [Acidimicrobiales bacterium]HRW38065.1 hypothetical protein [Aquihabitans sp.]